MPDQWYRLPDGSEINIPDDYTPAQLSSVFDRLSTEFPNSIGRAWSTYGQEEEEDEGNIFGALYQAVENLPRGAASVPLMGAQGIAALLTPHKDTAIEKKLRGAKDWLFSGIDPKYRESKIAGIGLGVGQIAPMMMGGAALASLGVGAAVPGMLTARGLSMASPAMKLLGGAQGVQSIAAGSLMSIPMHWGQYASGISDYEQRTGQDVSALKELAGFAPAALLGIGEMLPLSMMPGAGAASRKIAAQIGAGFAEKGALRLAKSFVAGAASEAVQESTAELGQMAIARALYDDEALADMGSRMWDAGIIGGGAGGIVSVLTNLAIRGSTGGAWGFDVAAEEALQRENNLRKGADPDLSIARAREEGMPVAESQETLDANRRKRFEDEVVGEEATRLEKFEQAQQDLENLIEEVQRARLRAERGPPIEGSSPVVITPLTDGGVTIAGFHGTRTSGKAAKAFGGIHIGTRRAAIQRLSDHVAGRVGGVPGAEKLQSMEVELSNPLGSVEDPISETELSYLLNIPGRLDEIKAQGVDGVIYRNSVEDRGQTSVLVFDPKSVRVGQTANVSDEVESFSQGKMDLFEEARRLEKIAAAEPGIGRPAGARQGSSAFETTDDFVPRWTTPEEVEAEVERRFAEDKAKEAARDAQAQEAQARATEEVGATFLELDQLHGMSAEEILDLYRAGQVTAETFDALFTADRISNVGGESRGKLREFVLRNAEINNRYSPALVATAILAGHPDVETGSETSSELFGEGSTRAVEMLVPSPGVFTSRALSRIDAGPKSREIVVEMSPDEFLDMAEAYDSLGATMEESTLEHLRGVESFNDVPMLTVSANQGAGPDLRVVGHEGRHRAVVMRERGVESFLVRLIANDSARIRWDEVTQLPPDLLTENGDIRAFPIRIEEVPQRIEASVRLSEGAGTPDTVYPLTPKSQALLAQESLSPAEVNFIINKVSDRKTGIKGFNADVTDNLIYGFSGNVGLYDRVNQDHAERATVWRQKETGELELTIPDPSEQSVTALIQEGVAKEFWEESGAEGLKLRTLIKKVLDAKNIVLNQNSRVGGTSFDSEAFLALLERVTGETSFRMQVQRPGTKGYKPGLTNGQKRALVGHIANLPTFTSPTLLPDLSRRQYSPEQAAALLEQLVIAREASKRSGKEIDSWVEALPKKTDVSPEEAAFRAAISRLRESPGVEPLDNLDQASQLVRHLVEAGYVTASTKNGVLGASLNEDTRPSTVEATEAATDPERAALEEEAVKKSETEKQLVSKIQKVKAALRIHLDRLSLPGLDFMLAADVDSIYDAIAGPEGIIESPDNMANSVAMLDGPNAQLWVSLSQIDPDGTRKIQDIIQDITEEVVHAYDRQGYWYEHELNTMDSRAFDTVVPASVSEEGHKLGLNFVQFAEKLYPGLNQQDMMSEARAKYMTALAKNQIPRGRTAGKVGNLKQRIISFLTAGIEAGREAEMQDMLSIFNKFQSGEVGRRGPPIPGQPRSLRLSKYADPRHIAELKKAIEEGDTDAEQRIAQDILDAKKFDMVQSAPPELTWRDKLFNQFLMDEELANTRPGEIPLIGINASERAINEYFRQKRGEQPYTMPEAIKHKFRNQERWAPSKELEDLVADRVSRVKAEPKLGGEIVIDAMSELDAFGALMSDSNWDNLTEKEQFKATREITNDYAKTWSQGFWKGLGKLWRYNIADGGYPVEKLGQMKDRITTGVRSLADSSAVAMLRWRNSVGNPMTSVYRLGGISWIGTPLDGHHTFQTYGPDQETLQQAFAHLQSAKDRKYAAMYSGAKRFLDMARKRGDGEPQAALALAKETGNQANIGFFKQQVRDRRWDVNLSTDEQIAAAQEMVDRIATEAPHVVEFSESYQAHNKRSSLPWLLSTGQITQEMFDYLQDMTYVPLYRDVGTAKSWPLGSNGRGEGEGKSTQRILQFGRMVESKGNVFDHALESFDGLEDVDLLRNILNSEMAMLRDGFSNLAARRVVRDTQELTERGYGIQSRQVDEAGPNVIRIMVDGQQEFHELADPLLANSVMTMGFSSTNNLLRAARIGAQVTRWGVVNFPEFIYRNFAKDARSVNIINASAKGSFFPLFDSIQRALEGDVLQRSLEAGLITGSGLYPSVQEQVGGMTALEEVLEGESAVAKGLRALGFKGIGTRLAKEARMQERYEEVSAGLKEGRMPLKDVGDYFSYIRVMYRNLQEVGESTARMGAHDAVLAATGSIAEANIAGLETLNFGRHGADPLVNAITSMIPFMSGQITGTDAFVRSWTGSPDVIGKHAVDPNMTDEAANAIKFRMINRGLFAAASLFAYYMMVRDDEHYKRAGEVEKMNNFLIPVGDKYFKVPTSFAAGALLKSIPESVLRSMDEEDYTPADVGEEIVDQVKRNLGFHIMPQIMRPMWYAMQNKNDFTRDPIVPRHMEDLPSEHQTTPYTSNSATRLGNMFGVLPGVDTLSSPMKMEYMLRGYFGQAATYSMLVMDRIAREYTGENVVGTRYDWAPSSLLTGEGIENFPVIGGVVGDFRQGRGDQDKFYELKEEVDIYVSVLNKLIEEGSREDVQEWIEDNIDTHNYRNKVRSFGRYNTKWRERRNKLLQSDWMSDDRKRELLFEMIEERDEVLDGLTSVKAGMRGLIPYNFEVPVI